MSGTRGEILGWVMAETHTSQSELARLSGVHQPSISQFLAGKVEFSDEQLDRLVTAMGYRLEVTRRVVEADLTPSERRSWRLHRKLATHLNEPTLAAWRPAIIARIAGLREAVYGQPHLQNLERWEELVSSGDLGGLRRVLTGLDRSAIEMREVSPMGGLLPEAERLAVLQSAAR